VYVSEAHGQGASAAESLLRDVQEGKTAADILKEKPGMFIRYHKVIPLMKALVENPHLTEPRKGGCYVRCSCIHERATMRVCARVGNIYPRTTQLRKADGCSGSGWRYIQ